MAWAMWMCVVAACGPAATPRVHTPIKNDGTQTGSTAVMASLERTMCYGTCPAYVVVVHEDGSVDYDGQQFVKLTGKHAERISPQQVQALREAFIAAQFDAFNDSYEHENVTDNPSATLTFVGPGGATKTVRHYHGDRSAPPALTKLEDDFDRIVGTDQWIGTQEERDHLPRR